MSKTTLKPAQETELIVAGTPSGALLAKLKTAGAKITDEQILASVSRAEDARTRFHHAGIETGLLLLAKKQTVRHGQWGKWCTAFVAKLETRFQFEGDATRSLRHYTFIAQHFLADLEQGTEEFQVIDPKLPARIEPADVLALDTLPDLKREAVSRQIFHWVRGRSLRQLLADLRRADHAAAEEETTENPPKPHKSIKGHAADHAAAAVLPPITLNAEQLELWQDVAHPLQALDTLLNDEDAFLSTDRDFWKAVVMSLDARLAAARERLSNVA